MNESWKIHEADQWARGVQKNKTKKKHKYNACSNEAAKINRYTSLNNTTSFNQWLQGEILLNYSEKFTENSTGYIIDCCKQLNIKYYNK